MRLNEQQQIRILKPRQEYHNKTLTTTQLATPPYKALSNELNPKITTMRASALRVAIQTTKDDHTLISDFSQRLEGDTTHLSMCAQST